MLSIHPNARTTPAVRAEIARSAEPTGALAKRYGVSTETVRKWRQRGPAACRDRSSRPHKLPWKASDEERAVAGLRRELTAEARATTRFETPPGRQMQIDFGGASVSIGGETVRVHLFVATLGHSRRTYVQAFRHERQTAWLDGIEGVFRHFGGLPAEMLLDNARALVTHHDVQSREVIFNERLHAFGRYWGVRPRACAPYRARTKGKDERGVGYVKRNAIAGRNFASWAALEAHLAWWMREVADRRVHGTTGEPPIVRFERDEKSALRPLAGKPPFRQMRDLVRRVQPDCAVEVDTNAYSVPWRLIGERVRVTVVDGWIRIFHHGAEVAAHPEAAGRRQRLIEPAHFQGVPGFRHPGGTGTELMRHAEPEPTLLRPLAEYERAVGGAW